MKWKLFVPFWSVVVRLLFHGMESVGSKQQYGIWLVISTLKNMLLTWNYHPSRVETY